MKYILTLIFIFITLAMQAQTPDPTSFTVTKDSLTRITFTKEVAQGATRIITVSEVSGTDSSLMQMYLDEILSAQVSRANDIAIISKYRKDLTSDLKSLRNLETQLNHSSDSLVLKYRDITKGAWVLNKDKKEWKPIKFKLTNKGKLALISESKTYRVDFLYNVIRIYDFAENLEILDLYYNGAFYIDPCGRFELKKNRD